MISYRHHGRNEESFLKEESIVALWERCSMHEGQGGRMHRDSCGRCEQVMVVACITGAVKG